MSNAAKMQKQYLTKYRVAATVEVGKIAYLRPSALLVDLEGRCWIDPAADVLGDQNHCHPSDGGQVLRVGRGTKGFSVSFSRLYDHKWTLGEMPDRSRSRHDYIAAVEVDVVIEDQGDWAK